MQQGRLAGCLFLLAALMAACAGCTASLDDLHLGRDATGGWCSLSTPAHVVRVIDGDTFCVTYSDGSEDTVRILGVDTPETNDRGNSEGGFAGISDPSYLTSWGKRASSFTRDLLLGKDVILSGDCRAGSRDQYGRLLSYVTSDGIDVGSLLVKEGYAEGLHERRLLQKAGLPVPPDGCAGKRSWSLERGTGSGRERGWPGAHCVRAVRRAR